MLSARVRREERGVFWRDEDGTVTVGTAKLSEAEFDAYCDAEFDENTTIYVVGWEGAKR